MRKTITTIMITVTLLATFAPAARAQDPAPALRVANRFYQWYFKQGKDMWDHLPQVRPLFDPALHKMLWAWYKSNTVDFDPFINAQIYAKSYTLGKVKFDRDFALIPVSIKYERGSGQGHFTMVLHRAVDHYEIWNFVYDPKFDLRSMLEKETKH